VEESSEYDESSTVVSSILKRFNWWRFTLIATLAIYSWHCP